MIGCGGCVTRSTSTCGTCSARLRTDPGHQSQRQSPCQPGPISRRAHRRREVRRSAGRGRAGVRGDTGPILDAIEEFVTGELAPPSADRVLATVLFTDIVDSTAHAVRIGDRRWRELLVTHDAVINEELDRFRGRTVKSTGDGVLALFDGPARAIRCAIAIRDACPGVGLGSTCRGAHRRDRTPRRRRRRVSPSTPLNVSRRSPQQARFSCRVPSPIYSPVPGSTSTTLANTNSKAYQAPGALPACPTRRSRVNCPIRRGGTGMRRNPALGLRCLQGRGSSEPRLAGSLPRAWVTAHRPKRLLFSSDTEHAPLTRNQPRPLMSCNGTGF